MVWLAVVICGGDDSDKEGGLLRRTGLRNHLPKCCGVLGGIDRATNDGAAIRGAMHIDALEPRFGADEWPQQIAGAGRVLSLKAEGQQETQADQDQRKEHNPKRSSV